jgi:hypothetical protein
VQELAGRNDELTAEIAQIRAVLSGKAEADG